jgi:hypothetical protein
VSRLDPFVRHGCCNSRQLHLSLFASICRASSKSVRNRRVVYLIKLVRASIFGGTSRNLADVASGPVVFVRKCVTIDGQIYGR